MYLLKINAMNFRIQSSLQSPYLAHTTQTSVKENKNNIEKISTDFFPSQLCQRQEKLGEEGEEPTNSMY